MKKADAKKKKKAKKKFKTIDELRAYGKEMKEKGE